MTAAAAGRPDRRTRPLLLWFGFLGSSVAWLLALVVPYGVEDLACSADAQGHVGVSPGTIRVVAVALPALLAVVAAASGLVALARWRRSRSDHADDVVAVLGAAGVALAAVFVLGIAMFVATALALEACA